jgi:hypothetical protein
MSIHHSIELWALNNISLEVFFCWWTGHSVQPRDLLNLESIQGPIQKQPVSYTILLEDGLGTDILDFLGDSMGPLFLKPTKEYNVS